MSDLKKILKDWATNPYFLFLLGLFIIQQAHLAFVGMESTKQIFQTRTAQGVVQYWVLDLAYNIVPFYVCSFLIYLSHLPAERRKLSLKQKIQIGLFALTFAKDGFEYLMTSNFDFTLTTPARELELSLNQLKLNAIILLSGILILEVVWKMCDFDEQKHE